MTARHKSLDDLIFPYPQMLSQLQWWVSTVQTNMTIFSMDKDKGWHQPSSPLYEVTLDVHQLWPVESRHLSAIRWKAVEWYKEVAGPEDNSPMDNNQSGDVYQKDTVAPERLEDWKDTICSEEVKVDWLSEEGDWRTRGFWAFILRKHSQNLQLKRKGKRNKDLSILSWYSG